MGVDDPSLAGLRVVDAVAMSADTVLAYATEDGASPFVEPFSPDQGACRE